MNYIPKQGDIIILTFDPQTGHEQQGRRPALVISNNSFNSFFKTGAMVCPITSKEKDFPTRVKLDGRTKTQGIIMCDQAKILDTEKRNIVFVEKAPKDILTEVIEIVNNIIETED